MKKGEEGEGKEETEREDDKEGLGGGGQGRGWCGGRDRRKTVGKQGRTPKLRSTNKALPLLYDHQVYT